MKFYAYVTDPEKYIDHPVNRLVLHDYEVDIDGWILVGTIDYEVTLTPDDIRAVAIQSLEKEKERLKADYTYSLQQMDDRINQLKAITHNPEAS